MAINLKGVNESTFQDLYEGDEDIYVSVLKTFVEKTPGTLAMLANPTKQTLPDYAIKVHAVKGACANICVEDLKQKALRLEQLSKAGDLAGVQAGNDAFIKEVEALIDRAKDWLKGR